MNNEEYKNHGGMFGIGNPNDAFSHIAVEVPGEDTSTEWCESVTEEYDKLN